MMLDDAAGSLAQARTCRGRGGAAWALYGGTARARARSADYSHEARCMSVVVRDWALRHSTGRAGSVCAHALARCRRLRSGGR